QRAVAPLLPPPRGGEGAGEARPAAGPDRGQHRPRAAEGRGPAGGRAVLARADPRPRPGRGPDVHPAGRGRSAPPLPRAAGPGREAVAARALDAHERRLRDRDGGRWPHRPRGHRDLRSETHMMLGLLLAAQPQVVAVLEFQDKVPPEQRIDAAYLSDQVRGAVKELLPSAKVITRENMLVLLQASGKDLADCEGECEVDTGRRIGADLVVSGELLRFGT